MTYTLSFGDGSAPVQVEDGVEVKHEYKTSGTYTITATGPNRARGTTRFVANVPQRAKPVMVATPNPVPVKAGTKATWEVRVTNAQANPQSDNCTGRLTVTGLTKAQITEWRRTGLLLVVNDVGGKAVATYGGGPQGKDPFPILKGMDATATYELTLAAAVPAGQAFILSEILDSTGYVIGSYTYPLNITAST